MQQRTVSDHSSEQAHEVKRLYRRFGPLILTRCRRALEDEALTERAAVEVFGRVWRRLDEHAGVMWIAAVSGQVCKELLDAKKALSVLALVIAVSTTGCMGTVSDLGEPPLVPYAAVVIPDAAVVIPDADAGEDAGSAEDAGMVTLDAGTVEPIDAGFDAGLTMPDAGSVLVDAGYYPGLPASCQGLLNRTHGTCDDAYANPNYGSVQWDFRGDVAQAITDVGQPAGFFNGDEVLPARRDDYARLVAAQLDAVGLCAVWASGELYVRDRTRDLNETFSLFTAAGRPRAGGHWQCAPSDEIPGTQPAFTCGLAPSAGTSCGGSGQNLFGDVVSLVEEVIQEEQPKGAASRIIDFNFKSLHVRGWRLKDDGYPFVAAVARKANARGYCVQSSGWKWINLKLGSNVLSEKYSLVTHVSLPNPTTQPALYAACMGDGILPSCEFIIEKGEDTCRPADF